MNLSRLLVTALLTLAACSDNVTGPTGADASVPEEPPPVSVTPSQEDDEGSGGGYEPCRRTQKVVVPWDGGHVDYVIPLPCDPFWKLKDRGDPQP